MYKINQLWFDLRRVYFIERTAGPFVGHSKAQGTAERMLAVPDLEEKPTGTAHIPHQCRKTTVLSCHRCLIKTGVEKMNNI